MSYSSCNLAWKVGKEYTVCGRYGCNQYNAHEKGGAGKGLKNTCNKGKLGQPCPTGYRFSAEKYQNSKDFGDTGSVFCAGADFDEAQFSVCERDPNALSIYNSLYSQIYDGGTGRIKDDTKEKILKAKRCCSGEIVQADPVSKECGDLYVPTDSSPESCGGETANACKVVMGAYCLGDIRNGEYSGTKKEDIKSRLEEVVCQKYCKDHDCDDISEFCKYIYDNNGNKPDPAYKSICACHYPSDVYESGLNEIAKKYHVPEDFLSGASMDNRTCLSKACNGSPYKRESDQPGKCPGISLVNCVANTNFDILNSTIEKIEVNQRTECSGQFREKQPGETNNRETRESRTKHNNTSNENNAPDNDGPDNDDPDEDEPSDKSDDTIMIIAIIGVVLILLGALAMFM